jgi:aspartate ammonia-lyase
MVKFRTERDLIGEMNLPADCLYGIHTGRALENFPLAGRAAHPEFVRAFGIVKLACAVTNRALGVWRDNAKADAIERACREMADGLLTEHIVVDSLQGGAGTSMNMNVNEVLANRALQILGYPPGSYEIVSPFDDINLHQSTNDTYPTALKLAAIRLLHVLEDRIVGLQEAFQAKEKQFAHVVKVGRTEMQDAVLTTLGREMSAYAEAFNRDRWRIYKCEERLRVVNLGGTAIGTGLGAPRQFIFRVVDTLRDLSGIGFARAENLIEATQNADVFVEVSGILKACAVSLLKVSTDLRIMSSGPEAGLGEIRLPARQAGSSIMPGKVNPVIPEAVSQIAMLVMGYDQTIALAAASGNLELNAFLPVIAQCLLESCDLLARGADILRRLCVEGIEADEERCRKHVESSTATATALLPLIGYEAACRLVQLAAKTGKSIKETAIEEKMLTAQQFDELVSPEAVCRLGSALFQKRDDNG